MYQKEYILLCMCTITDILCTKNGIDMDIKRKISFYLQKVYTRDSKEAQIRMRVRWDGNIAQFNVGYSIDPTKWIPESGRCKKNITNKKGTAAFDINKEIQRLESLAEDTFKSFEVMGSSPGIEEYKNAFNKANGKQSGIQSESLSVQRCFSDYVREAAKKNSWADATIMKHASIKRILCDFNPDWKIDNVNSTTLDKYYDFLISRDMQNSTIKKHLSFLRSFFLWCNINKVLLSEDWKTFTPEIKTIRNKQVIFLTWEELIRLYELEFPEDKKYLDRARDVFCFQCFTSLRFSDVYQLKRSDVYPDHIRVCTEKTDCVLNIDLNERAKTILKKYENETFPKDKALPVVSNQKSNVYIKECCHVAEINAPITITYYKGRDRIDETHPKYKLIGTHSGRRTFICNALMLGISPEVVMKWTGHTDYRQMQPYIDVANEEKKKAMDKFNK